MTSPEGPGGSKPLERFELIEKIGRGGMGVVWKARDRETGAIVALKLLHAAYADEPDYVVRFERELELAQRIHSANVVAVLGYGVRDGTPYLALAYVDGPTARQMLTQHGPYTWDETKSLLTQVATGLNHAHSAGVVHRDVKPSNILVGSDGVAKLADFGIARGVDMTRVTGTSTLLGTPAYLPPEGATDERSDLYSLGIVAYELLVGVPPFEGDTFSNVLLAHLRTPPNLGRLPEAARPVIGWMLQKDPDLRPQSAGELLAVLGGKASPPMVLVAAPVQVGAAGLEIAAGAEIAAGGPVPTSPALLPAEGWRPGQGPPRRRRRRTGVLLLMGGLAMVVAAGAVWGTAGGLGNGSGTTPQRSSGVDVAAVSADLGGSGAV